MKRIVISGTITSNSNKQIYQLTGEDATCPKDVTEHLKGTENVEVLINSGGGDVISASEIYTALRSHLGHVTVNVYGLAASAASVVAMAGDRVLMSPTSQMMIHNASTVSGGNRDDMEHTSIMLHGIDQSIANAYIIKTGKSQSEILKMMSKETWFTAQEAVKHNFVNGIMFEDDKEKSHRKLAMLKNKYN